MKHTVLFLACVLTVVTAHANAQCVTAPADGQTPLENIPGLHHVLRVTPEMLSGGKPEGDEAFESLNALGIKTVICVDGATPDVDMAKAAGLQYVHIPIGYDGVEPEAAASLRKALKERKGPYYIHCHHGKHRGPAMAAIAKRLLEEASAEEGAEFLERAGTSPNYPGLWKAVREFSLESIADLDPEIYEVAPVGGLTREMAVIDEHFEALRDAETTGWETVPEHPDLTPIQAALLVWERFHELVRAGQDEYDARYDELLLEADKLAENLHEAVEAGDAERASKALSELAQNCSACHEAYRNTLKF